MLNNANNQPRLFLLLMIIVWEVCCRQALNMQTAKSELLTLIMQLIRIKHCNCCPAPVMLSISGESTTMLKHRIMNQLSVNRASVFQLTVSKEMECCQVGGQSFLVTVGNQSLLLQFKTTTGLYIHAYDIMLMCVRSSNIYNFLSSLTLQI